MKTTIETLEFPCEIKKKLKMKVSMGNLEVEFIDGHLIKFDKTNLSVQEPYKIIVSNKKNTLVDDWTTQRLYMSFARTTITNPCPNCTYVIKPYEETTKWRVGTAIQMGMHKDIPESQMPGKYALYAQRAEVTLVDSVIQGTWWID